MKILILVISFPPEIRSASHLFYELSESLVEKGHQVTVITRIPKYNIPEPEEKYKRKIFLKENMRGIGVIRVADFPFPRSIPLARALGDFLSAFIFFIAGLFIKRRDIILVYSPPLLLGLSAYLLKIFKKSPFIFNVQDIYPQAAIDLRLLKNPFLIRLAKSIEKFIYNKTDFITVHSKGNYDHLVSRGVNPKKIKVIPNWVDTDLIKPENRINQFRKENNLGNSFVVSFAGVMGFAQDLETIIGSAKVLEDFKEIKFLLIGEGIEKERIQKKAKELNLKNVKFLPMQRREIYPQILVASDICLVTLKKEVKTPVVPGKIISIMAAGRPIIASFPGEGDAAKLIRDAQAGIVVEPGEPKKFAGAILKLYQNNQQREMLGENARKYAKENFSRETCIQQYEELSLRIIKK